LLQGKEQEIYSLNVPGQGSLITLEDIDRNECRALGGEEGSVRERALLGLYSKRLFDYLDCIVVWRAAI
jgi:hypothetical protein